MRQILTLVVLFSLACSFVGCGSSESYVLIETNMGDIKVLLFDNTPKHKENFLKLAEEGYLDGTLFHRVIPEFMIQGGDPDSKGAGPNVPLGSGGPNYLIDPEIGAPHLRGALAAARTSNPEKRSSGSQFYLVTGVLQSAATLDQYERVKNIKYSPEQREAYMTQGGRPDLDMEYTVFGQVVSGMEVVDKISALPTRPGSRPIQDVVMERVSVVR
ncbi:peptidylprolyl isomerase [Neolewinella lacunae]|uniref:Peptidyl-prolyl cis-trans isomerase n=1 Tax=Neolewinella lacunae TaxID=1517758 RepID=A0A923PR06_9BACT|nr:peptidylprolyl isomerase [Neolewinella lacunae]MBC6995868.1 peptidylprolyl isomerase [Neolewinella lacunae]MDN3636439.1 peptidylprolyl isomerase [Neolewinella lacunae]